VYVVPVSVNEDCVGVVHAAAFACGIGPAKRKKEESANATTLTLATVFIIETTELLYFNG